MVVDIQAATCRRPSRRPPRDESVLDKKEITVEVERKKSLAVLFR